MGRLLEAKGIREYCEAAKIIKTKYPETSFQILGPKETGPGSISSQEIADWKKDGIVSYLGETSNVIPFVSAAHVLVLPSWREGLPTCVMEAMSLGRACLVTDVPGCRQTVIDYENGLVVPVKNPQALAQAMEKFITNPSLLLSMGNAGREIAERQYDTHVVAAGILSDMGIPASPSSNGDL